MKLKEDRLRTSTRKITIWFPMTFVLRRIAFVAIAFLLNPWPVFQLMAMSYITTAMVIYLLWFSPFEDNFYNRIEVLNEITAMLLLYFMFTFTDWIPSAGDRYNYAWLFIAITCANLGVHLFFLMKENMKRLHLKWIRYTNKKKSKQQKKKKIQKILRTRTASVSTKLEDIPEEASGNSRNEIEDLEANVDVLLSIESSDCDLGVIKSLNVVPMPNSERSHCDG